MFAMTSSPAPVRPPMGRAAITLLAAGVQRRLAAMFTTVLRVGAMLSPGRMNAG
ncbi:hypothetical protein BSE24067_00445 [Burkholderia seminalis]|nr:hypothetical protein BSE24067_00445 [Burkholderia seminalis]